jgi:hypothetical protein
MSLRFFVRLFLLLSAGLNLPGLLVLVAHAVRPLEVLVLLLLPLVALWGLPGVLFLKTRRALFEVTEFGVYPRALYGWVLLFGSWQRSRCLHWRRPFVSAQRIRRVPAMRQGDAPR